MLNCKPATASLIHHTKLLWRKFISARASDTGFRPLCVADTGRIPCMFWSELEEARGVTTSRDRACSTKAVAAALEARGTNTWEATIHPPAATGNAHRNSSDAEDLEEVPRGEDAEAWATASRCHWPGVGEASLTLMT